jgi:hypothetical protein
MGTTAGQIAVMDARGADARRTGSPDWATMFRRMAGVLRRAGRVWVESQVHKCGF